MRKTLKATLVAAAVAGTVASSAGVAFADDCFNASRSTTGNTSAATHSRNWIGIDELIGYFPLTPQQAATASTIVHADSRIPSDWTLFLVPSKGGNIYELAQNAPARLATNGKGIDHSDDLGYFEAFIGDLIQAGLDPALLG
jgi:hypothetical protein